MLRNKIHLFIPALVALILTAAPTAFALQSRDRVAQGNNVGLEVSLSSTIWNGTSQFPKGSGNLIPTFEGGWGHVLAVVRDKNGDGLKEDTLYGGGRARSMSGQNNSLESYSELQALYDAGERMSQASSRIEHNRVWTSLDAEDLASWPPEFREGRSASGAPILHGAETIVARLGDAFNSSFAGSNAPRGADFEYTMYFLNFAESNNMVYGKLFIRNMSEYLKWNDNAGFTGQVASTPDGQNWNFVLCYNTNYFGIGTTAVSMDEGWAFQPRQGIEVMVDYNGMESGFTNGGVAFHVGHVPLRLPMFKDQQIVLSGHHCARFGSEFGGPVAKDVYGLADAGLVYRASLGELLSPSEVETTAQQMYGGQINPFTGRPIWGWPGTMRPTDQYYDSWLWGRMGRFQYTTYGEFRDFGPRDSTSYDFALMFVYPKNAPMVLKQTDLANLYDPAVQVGMENMSYYAEVAQVVYEGGYILPETPVPPPLTIIPGDRQVTITWSNINLNTPDAYYGFLQQHPELDPNGLYRQYDFEGYRLYRSFVGPSDSHSEQIWEGNLTNGSVAFSYVDRWDADQPYYRLRDGLRVWYALVPYDRNYDPAQQIYFSLPDPASGKTWNRPREGMYTVTPRSDASNYRPAELKAISFEGSGATVQPAGVNFATLSGQKDADGNGWITQTPVFLAPAATITLTPVIDEKITQDFSVYLGCTDWGPNGYRAGRRYVSLLDASGNVLDNSAPHLRARSGGGNSKVAFNGGMSSDGATYALAGQFDSQRTGTFQTQIETGGYTGADVGFAALRWGMSVSNPYYSDEAWVALVRTGQYKISWKSSGSGVSVDVVDNVRGVNIPFSPYIDGGGWGFCPTGTGPYDFHDELGVVWGGDDNEKTPQADRSNLLVETLPAGNTEEFNLFVGGQFFNFANVSSMPAAGAVMTVTTAFGAWNSDNTAFTQEPGPMYLGDRWKIDVQGFTMNKEDIDLGKIKVVPNPYIASSVLDLSPLSRRIEFVNLPDRCTIRIYTLGGNLVNVLNHIGSNRFGWGNYTDYDKVLQDNSAEAFAGYDNHSGTEPWNLRNRFGQTVASGLYFFHVTDARGKEFTGKFYVIN